jgi:tripartite-type tricarboxylate transporter receptor subunit TctC
MHFPMAARAALVSLAAFVSLSVSAPAGAQQAFPSKPVRIIVPFPGGGAVDQLARTVGQRLSGAWGQPAVIENRAGGGGIIGTDAIAKSAADGHSMGVVANSYTIHPLLQAKLPYDIFKDLQPVALLAWTPHILVVQPSLPIKSVQELIDFARANPGKLSYASVGSGTTLHLAGEMLKSAAKVDIVHVPFQGSAPTITAMLGGHVSMMFAALTDVQPHVQTGKMRALATGTARRVDAIKDLPTANEAGLKGFDSWSWFGMVAPAAVPRDLVARINAEINRQLRSPEARERLDTLGLFAMDASPDEFAAIMRADYAKYAKVVKEGGIKAD